MKGTFQKFQITQGSFGQQYATIDGVRYLTWFDLMDQNLRGLRAGATVEYEVRAGPTVLCDMPLVQSGLASAKLVRVVKTTAEAM
jgi:hypothetical protein